MRTVPITLIGPERTSDLVVDADTPVAELLPSLLRNRKAVVEPLGTYAVDKGVEWAWDHRGEIGHALESAESAVAHTTSRVVHEIEPWRWHL